MHNPELVELSKRLRVWTATGYTAYSTFTVGMHVLQRMVKQKSTTVTLTWGEMANSCVVEAGVPVAPPAPTTRYEFYGALQQLCTYVGLFSHVSRLALGQDIDKATQEEDEEGQGGGIGTHFTLEPGLNSDIIGPDTLLVFKFVPETGYSLEASVGDLLSNIPKLSLPRWVGGAAVCL